MQCPRERLPPSAASSRRNIGHVVKHRIAAHKAAEMNGSRMSRQPATSNATAAEPIQSSMLCSDAVSRFTWSTPSHCRATRIGTLRRTGEIQEFAGVDGCPLRLQSFLR